MDSQFSRIDGAHPRRTPRRPRSRAHGGRPSHRGLNRCADVASRRAPVKGAAARLAALGPAGPPLTGPRPLRLLAMRGRARAQPHTERRPAGSRRPEPPTPPFLADELSRYTTTSDLTLGARPLPRLDSVGGAMQAKRSHGAALVRGNPPKLRGLTSLQKSRTRPSAHWIPTVASSLVQARPLLLSPEAAAQIWRTGFCLGPAHGRAIRA